MNQQQIVESCEAYVKQELKNAEGGHDWFHIARVRKMALRLAREEDANLFVVELAALLHDIADYKFHGGDEEIGPAKAREFLSSEKLDPNTIDQVVLIIQNISFKGGHSAPIEKTKEFEVVQDADRLDALGAIGIARTFNFGGYKGTPLYDPSVQPNPGMSKHEYKKANSPTVNHFYEKLLLLKDRMNTESARSIAAERHRFMEQYLKQFFSEWEAEL